MSALRSGARAIGSGISRLLLGCVRAAAVLLTPWAVGRLLSSVSIPRMQQHPLRTTSTILGVGVGVAVVIAVMLVNASVMRAVAATVDHLAGKADLQVSAGTSGFDHDLLDSVRSVSGVHRASAMLQHVASVRGHAREGERLLLIGVDLLDEQDRFFRDSAAPEFEAIRRDPLPFLNSPYHLILSRAFAERMAYRAGGQITLSTSHGAQAFEIWGLMQDEGVTRAFGGAVAIMDLSAMQVAFDRGDHVDRIDIAVARGRRAAAVQAALQHRLGAAFWVDRPSQRSASVEQMLLGIRSALMMASLIALLVGGFLIHNATATSVVQRKHEIATLRALGATRGQLTWLFALEGVLMGAVGSLLGIALGVGLARLTLSATLHALAASYLQVASSDVPLQPHVLAAGFVLGVVASTFAAVLPARRAATIQPAHGLRAGSGAPRAHRRRRLSTARLGLCLLAAAACSLQLPPVGRFAYGAYAGQGLLVLAVACWIPGLIHAAARVLRLCRRPLLGLRGQLAFDNMQRDLDRSSATVAALMVGVGMAIGFNTFIDSFAASVDNWLRQTAPGDLFVTSSAGVGGASLRNTPLEDALTPQLRAVPGVADLRRLRFAEIPFRNLPIKIVATDFDVFERHSDFEPLEGRHEEIVRGLRRGQLAVSENFARRFEVHRGDSIALATHASARDFTVAGVLVDYTSDLGSIWMDRQTYVEAWQDTRVDTYELHLHPGTRPQAVRDIINRRFGERYDLFVLTNAQFRSSALAIADQLFSLLRALEIAALLSAALGIVNALMASVSDRQRPIGVLRSLGMLRREVRDMFVAEAALLGALGVVAGTVAGLGLGYVSLQHVNLVQSGWHFPFHISLISLAGLALLTIALAALSGWYPARQAARVNIPEAIAHD